VRFVTYEPGDRIPVSTLVRYTSEAARLATMSRAERLTGALDRELGGSRARR
jgi:hypothetical protein